MKMRLINLLGLPYHEGFIEHRHDQSIFSILIKKYSIKVYRDPSQHGNNFVDLYPDSKYQQLMVSTRQMNITFFEYIRKSFRPYLSSRLRDFYINKIKKKLRI